MKKSKILIDGDYLYHLIKRFKIEIDFHEFYDLLIKILGDSVIYYYSSLPIEDKKQVRHLSFLNNLEKFGYNIKKFKLIKSKSEGIYSSNIDVQIVLDAMEEINKFNSLVLISGDSDFIPLFKKVKNKGKETILIGIPSATSNGLIKESDKFYNLSKTDTLLTILNFISPHTTRNI